MSAILQLAALPRRTNLDAAWKTPHHLPNAAEGPAGTAEEQLDRIPSRSLAFYRKHTEKLLRRYLYSSMLVGRAPSILEKPMDRGWASYRRLETFEDSVIFVLDMERCLDKLEKLDRQLIARVVLQEYSHSEASLLLGLSTRFACARFGLALDRLTEMLLDKGILKLPSTT